MKALLRFLLFALVAAWFALPSMGTDGGEGAGGTGVWILPRPTFLASASGCGGSGAVRGSTSIPADAPLTLKACDELGLFTATLVDPLSGASTLLPCNGFQVALSSDLLRTLRETCGSAHVVIADGTQLGYLIQITFDSASGAGVVKVF
ncbi:MAG: hypothetical protein KF830_09465 [Planctomycetes bacterium]|nr:hypothetical protein [Planctomycetota bacterium]